MAKGLYKKRRLSRSRYRRRVIKRRYGRRRGLMRQIGRVVSRMSETKYAYVSGNKIIGTATVAPVDNIAFVDLHPTIPVGTSRYGARLGSRIFVKGFTIHYEIACFSQTASETFTPFFMGVYQKKNERSIAITDIIATADATEAIIAPLVYENVHHYFNRRLTLQPHRFIGVGTTEANMFAPAYLRGSKYFKINKVCNFDGTADVVNEMYLNIWLCMFANIGLAGNKIVVKYYLKYSYKDI